MKSLTPPENISDKPPIPCPLLLFEPRFPKKSDKPPDPDDESVLQKY